MPTQCKVTTSMDLVIEYSTGCVEQYNGTAYTEIVYGPAGNKLALMNGQTATKVFAPLSGGATAVYNSSGLQYYRHPDWLGSSRVASTPNRTVYYNGAYAPYGENYAETGTMDRNFTGQNQDLTPGSSGVLYDFQYREQHSTEGRWISPDPAGIGAADPTSPQSWNRYAYVLGNPLTNTDSLGLCSASDNPPCYSTTGTGQMPAYTLSFSSCAQFVMFFNLTNFPGGGNPCAALSGFLGGASLAFLVDQQSTGGDSAAANNHTCQLDAPGGNYNVGQNAVALFQPEMASALTGAFNFLNSHGITPLINSGYRSPADQMRMRNGASGPNPAAIVSWHQAGMAVDINGTTSSSFPTIISAMQAQGLTWGGTFSHRDPPHFQLPRAGTSPTAAMVNACAATAGGH
jgi:RHS repeat-associated protein